MNTSKILRLDRDKVFRQGVLEKYENRCCFTPSLVKDWAIKKKYTTTELDMRCNATAEKERLMIYRKDNDATNASLDNFLLLCKQHYGVIYNELKSSPKRALEGKSNFRKETKQTTVLTKDEFKAMLSQVNDPMHLMLLQTLYYLGGRITEIMELRKCDLILSKDNPHVNFRSETTKRKVERDVSIPASMLYPYKQYVMNLKEEDKLFDITPQRAWQLVKLYAKKANIRKNIHPHTFRHTYATEVYDVTQDIKTLQELMGHKNMSTTAIYAHVSKEHKREVINKVFK